MIVVFWTTGTLHSSHDHYIIFEDVAEAQAKFESLKTEDNILCFGLAPITQASEPHWIND